MSKNGKTPAMILQELTVKHKMPPPTYNIIHSINGSHQNRFDYEVAVGGITARGSGSSKQIGKHLCAQNALAKLQELGIYNPQDSPIQLFNPILKETQEINLNHIMKLNEFCTINKLPYPEFVELSAVGPPHCKEFTYECKIGSIRTQMTGNSKKIAKQFAAREMIEKVKNLAPESTELDCDDIKEVLDLYAKNTGVVTNKSIDISDFNKTIAMLMKERGLTVNDFKKELEDRDEDAVASICNKLELSYNIFTANEMTILQLTTDTPFVVITPGEDEYARTQLFVLAFEMLESFMSINV